MLQSAIVCLDGSEISASLLKIGRSPVQVSPKTNFSIMIKLPVKSTRRVKPHQIRHLNSRPLAGVSTVAYLGFQKGSKFSLATNAYTKGARTSFPSFFQCQQKFFVQGEALPNPPKYATGYQTTMYFNCVLQLYLEGLEGQNSRS